MMPMRLENWSAEDLEVYCAGPFLTTDRQTATKRWLEISAAMPDEAQEARARKPFELGIGEMRAMFGLDEPARVWERPKLHEGSRALSPKNHSGAEDFLYVAKTWSDERSDSDEWLKDEETGKPLGRLKLKHKGWSKAQVACSAHRNPIPKGRRKYCSDECARLGANAKNRNRERRDRGLRKWPADTDGWYVQSWPPPPRKPVKVPASPKGVEPWFPTGADETGDTSVVLLTYGDKILPLVRRGETVAVTTLRRLFYGQMSIPRPDLSGVRRLMLVHTNAGVWKITLPDRGLAC
ncbi:Uncharacterised protein [Mycobacteroides abscessus subsp. massiliense]|nr:Uncharacterised protein [Mycobacteroides abscessus subsp. massiliense]SKU77402.1 Uncharacterised protein [Mycobacteroides abscessus subsp. massiliense]